jgi:hypothetical protein
MPLPKASVKQMLKYPRIQLQDPSYRTFIKSTIRQNKPKLLASVSQEEVKANYLKALEDAYPYDDGKQRESLKAEVKCTLRP